MKKFVLAVALIGSLISTSAFAWGAREQGILTGIAGLWTYQQLDRAGRQQPQIVYQQPPVVISQPPVVYQTPVPVYQTPAPRTVYVYPTNVPIPYGMSCSLHSEMVNGQVVTGNYCYYN